MSNTPPTGHPTEPTYRVEIADLLESHDQHKADELAAKAAQGAPAEGGCPGAHWAGQGPD